jgi:hypothetical protein
VNVTVPVGDTSPDTVALHDEVEPTAKDVSVQETVVVVAVVVTARLAIPALDASFAASPG